ncbi:MAG: hypothetical protein ACHQ2E_11185 [Gemmatimonadales bacterium]
MPTPSLVRAFRLFHLTLGAVVLIQSVQTVLAARNGGLAPGDRVHGLVLGSLEAVAALLFLLPRTMRAGAVMLLVIFAAAFGLHALRGDVATTLLVYAAGVLFVREHGTVPLRSPATIS